MNYYDEQESKRLRNLLFSVMADDKSDLSVFERLYVVERFGIGDDLNQRYLAELYNRCGCLAEATNLFLKCNHYRKLGDIAWKKGEIGKARDYYSRPQGRNFDNGLVFRPGPDWDRLFRLSFVQQDWAAFFDVAKRAHIENGVYPRTIILGSSQTAGTPYLQMIAAAIAKSHRSRHRTIDKVVYTKFGVSSEDWDAMLRNAMAMDGEEFDRFKDKVKPRMLSGRQMTLGQALIVGNTERAREVYGSIVTRPQEVAETVAAMKEFLKTGEQHYLDVFVVAVGNGCGRMMKEDLVHKLVSRMGDLNKQPPERVITMLKSHRLVENVYFRELIYLKFRHRSQLSGSELLSGVFRRMSVVQIQSLTSGGQDRYEILTFRNLQMASDWAEIRLQEWAEHEGANQISAVAEAWAKSKDWFSSWPTQMTEWSELLDGCREWLEEKWQNEIDISLWKSEALLFELTKDMFKGVEVMKHSRPLWLSPQHLDIFAPDIGLAIEYMGKQHYSPVPFFGGDEGFSRTVELDNRKAQACRSAGIRLEYVRYDEDIKKRLAEISTLCVGRSGGYHP